MSKKIVEYHISRLSDRNVDARLRAIEELRLLADADALEALQEVFENDDNELVRKAAQRAGREIFLKNRTKDVS